MIYILVSILSWGLWAILDKKGVENIHPIQAQLWGYIFCMLNLPVYIWLLQANKLPFKIDGKSLGWLAAATLFSGIGSYAIISALKQRDAAEVVGYTSVYPVVTVLLGFLFLGETLTLNRVVGIMLAVAGVMVLSR